MSEPNEDSRIPELAETDEQKSSRARGCGEEIQLVLSKWGCELDVGVRLLSGRVDPIVNIVPK